MYAAGNSTSQTLVLMNAAVVSVLDRRLCNLEACDGCALLYLLCVLITDSL
jgi:hypothetical protein